MREVEARRRELEEAKSATGSDVPKEVPGKDVGR